MLLGMKTRNMRDMEKHWAQEAEKKAKLAKSKLPKKKTASQSGSLSDNGEPNPKETNQPK